MVELNYDAASALSLGRRERQEDSVAADFPVGAGHGFAVLADGMGGHAAGDIASQIAVTEMFSELKMLISDPEQLEENFDADLRNALRGVNACINHYAKQEANDSVMGSTLVAPVLFGDRLYWISVGDSPLFLFRDGKLLRLNEDHSMAPEIDRMHSQGLIDGDDAENHPDRQCLTSVLIGKEIPKIDCTTEPVGLQQGDIVIAASDGIQFLTEAQIEEVLATRGERPSVEISAALLREIKALDDPDQDNVSLCVIKVTGPPDIAATDDRPTTEAAGTLSDDTQSGDAAETPPAVTVLARTGSAGTRVLCVSRKAQG
ncbi:protein phosphatase 2C domain-containing protein [Roseovarius sp. CAU 1744]|uniref:PP2C family protein-serine/threonine phosphatase n=1 Tax=Roseovarius sp. CAU 1744 TaxID=3140368 RepID=UPI00325B2B9F